MKNMQIAGTGNSRYMKSAISETATWEEFRDMLRAGTFAFDFNGINEAGILQQGTPFAVDSILKDTTAELLGGDSSMVPDEALVALKNLISGLTADDVGAAQIATGTYSGAGKRGSDEKNTLTFGFTPKVVFISAISSDKTYAADVAVIAYGVKKFTIGSCYYTGGTDYTNTVAWGTNTMTWYTAGTSSRFQLDLSGLTYRYVAIG